MCRRWACRRPMCRTEVDTPGMDTLERLMAKSAYEPGPLDTPCLVWNGYRNERGYGITTHGSRRLERVHRVAWIERNGPIPVDKPHVLHRCDNPPCWAEDHLWVGTNSENMADKMAKGRFVDHHARKTHCPAGHPYTPGNLVHRSGRHRTCKTCHRERERRRKAALRAGGEPDLS